MRRWVGHVLMIAAFITFVSPWFGLLSEAAAGKSIAAFALVFIYAIWLKDQ